MGGFLEFFTDFTGSPGGGGPALGTAEYAVDRKFIALARRLIDKNIPQPNATWVSVPNDVVSNNNEPWNVTVPASTEYNIRILFFPVGRVNQDFLKYRGQTATNDGAIQAIFYKTNFTPKLKDYVKVWGRELIVNNVDEIRVIKDTIIYLAEFII